MVQPGALWNFFHYEKRSNKTVCAACDQSFSGKHTGNLLRHLKRKHLQLFQSILMPPEDINFNANNEESNVLVDPLESLDIPAHSTANNVGDSDDPLNISTDWFAEHSVFNSLVNVSIIVIHILDDSFLLFVVGFCSS